MMIRAARPRLRAALLLSACAAATFVAQAAAQTSFVIEGQDTSASTSASSSSSAREAARREAGARASAGGLQPVALDGLAPDETALRYYASQGQRARVEAEIARLSAVISDPALYAKDPKRFDEASKALAKAQATLAASEEEWLRLEMLKEELGA